MSAKPTHAELERAISSVPGVEEAHVTLLPDTGRSRLRIRLGNGEDAPTVSWAISATLRERFGIVLDPGAIRPKLSVSETPTPPPGETAEDAPGDEQPPAGAPPSASAPWPAPRSEIVEDRPEAAPATEPTSVPGYSGEADVVHQGSAGSVAADDQNAGVVEDDPIEGKVVVIGDRVELNEAARAVLSESLELASPQSPLEGTTGPAAPGRQAPEPMADGSDTAARGAGADTSPEDGADASLEEGEDAAPEAGADASDDLAPEAGADAAPEAGADAAPEAGAEESDDSAPEAGVDAAPEAGSEGGPGDDPDSGESTAADPILTAVASAQDPEDADDAARPAATHHRLWSAEVADEVDLLLRRGQESPRAAIRHLDTQIDVSDVRVTATLAHGGRSVTGEASSVPTRKGILRAVAEATVSALRQLTGDRLVVGVDSVEASVAGEPPMATVLVGIVTEGGEETLLGSSLVRQDPERAVMRATLDALNRRIEPWLEFELAG